MGDRTSFVRHAITAPAFDRDKAHRSRLIRDLQQHLQRRLILVAAPAGYGKTTFLADFNEHTDLPVAWVRLSEVDKDPTRLAHLTWASLTQRFHRLKKGLDLGEHSGSTPEALADLILSAIGERVPERFVLLLDDVHLVNRSAGSMEFISRLVDAQPANLTVLLSGREVPDIPLVPLIAEDALKTYGAEELALDLEELRDILKLRLDGSVSENEALAMLEETGGWVTGVLLSDLLAGEKLPGLAGSSDELRYEYLASAVFERQPEAVREFALRSAVLPVMRADACDVALAREDSREQLTELARRGLFISVTGDNPRSYEFHHLFRAFLLDHPDQDEVAVREIRLAAAEYFEQNGDPEAAFDLYMSAGAVEEAREVAEGHVNDLYERGRDETIRSWTAALRDTGQAGAQLLRRCAHVESQRGRIGRARLLIEEALAIAEITGDLDLRFKCLISTANILRREGSDREWRKSLEAAGELVPDLDSDADYAYRIYRSQYLFELEGNVTEALEYAESCLQFPENEISSSRHVFGLSHHGTILGSTGDLRGAERSFRKALKLVQDRDARRRIPVTLNNLGFIEFQLGNYQTGERLLHQAAGIARQLDKPEDVLVTQLSLGEIMADLGQYEQGLEHLERALRVAQRIEDNYWLPYTAARLSMTYRRSNRLDKAASIWEMFATSGGFGLWEGLAYLEKSVAHNLSDPDRLEKDVEWVANGENANIRTQCLTLLAWAFERDGQTARARSYLSAALAEGEVHGLGQIIAGEAMAYPCLLQAVVALRDSYRGIVEDILTRIERMEQYTSARAHHRKVEKDSGDRLSVKTLGTASINQAGERLERGLRPLHIEVFLYLLDQGNVIREKMMNTFWPHLPGEQQSANLHSAIHAIRETLGPSMISRTSSGYELDNENDVAYDARTFERSANLALKLMRTAPETLPVCKEAVDMFGGRFLPSFNSDWILQRRRELDELFVRVVDRYAQLAFDLKEKDRGLQAINRALEIDPFRESLHVHYMQVLSEVGRHHQIALHARRYRKRLAEELQLVPSEEFEKRYEQLMSPRRSDHPLRLTIR